MKHHITQIVCRLALLALACLPVQVLAAAVQWGSLYYELNTSTLTATVVPNPNDTPYSGNVEIPFLITPPSGGGLSYTVTAIADKAFSSCTGLTSVVIPPSVTSIGEEAFNYCRSLTSVYIYQIL